MSNGKSNWLYYAIDIASFFILIFLTGNWIIAFIVSGIIGFALEKIDPLSKM
ncbi:MAG: hypothetical protein FWH29_03515 [Methanobrevibacter sp.]|nr:hypothetical protein [Methanobrevibacter sp.]